MKLCTVLFFSSCDSDRVVLLLKQYYHLLLQANIEIKDDVIAYSEKQLTTSVVIKHHNSIMY